MLAGAFKPLNLLLQRPSFCKCIRRPRITAATFQRQEIHHQNPNPRQGPVRRKMYENERGGILICIWNIPKNVKRDEFHFLMARVPGVERWQFIAKGHRCQESAGYAYCECPSMEDADETIWLLRRFRVAGTTLRANLYDPRRVSWGYMGESSKTSSGSSEEDYAEKCRSSESEKWRRLGIVIDKSREEKKPSVEIDNKKTTPASKDWKLRKPRNIEDVKKLLKTKLKLIPDINEVLKMRVPKETLDGAKVIADWKRKKKEMQRRAYRAEVMKQRSKKIKPVRPPNEKLLPKES